MKPIIFDRDGIIFDSEGVNISSTTKAFKQLGIDITEEDKKQIVAKHPEDFCKYFLKKYDFNYNEFRKIQKQLYIDQLDKIPLFKKTIAFIKSLKGKTKLALTTSSKRANTEQVLKIADLENIFDVIVTFEDYENRKPAPDAYLTTAKLLKEDPKNCIVIEDSEVGLKSAKAAGMKVIIIPNKYTKDQDFSKADLVVDSADEIDLDSL